MRQKMVPKKIGSGKNETYRNTFDLMMPLITVCELSVSSFVSVRPPVGQTFLA